MANIKDRIEKIKEYFRGMRVDTDNNEEAIYVIVQFPPKWMIDKTLEETYGISIVQGNEYAGQYYFCAEMSVGFDALFDAIDDNIEKMKTAQERANLLKEKVMELREIFENEGITIESLRTLTFNYKQPKPKKKPIKKTEEITEKPMEETDNE